MIRHSVSALRWRDLVVALASEALARLRRGPSGRHLLRGALADALGVPVAQVHVTGTGRAALHALVSASRRGDDDEALLPGYTCVVVPHVFRHLGVPVRYVDLPPAGLNPRPADWAAAIGRHTRWVVVPHNFGVPSEGLPALRAQFPHVVFIEDAAHAWGARAADGRPLGREGHAAFFSFEYAKCLTTGLGGALLVNDPALAEALAPRKPEDRPRSRGEQLRIVLTLMYHLSQASWPAPLAAALDRLLRGVAGLRRLAAATPAGELSGDQAPDYQLALPHLLARLALPQLRRMPDVLARRRQQAAEYDRLLAGSAWLHPLAPPGATLLRYPVALADPSCRGAWERGLAELGIEPGCWFDDVVHPAGSAGHGYVAGSCPHGERLAATVANLPLGLHAELSAAQRSGLRQLAARPVPVDVAPAR